MRSSVFICFVVICSFLRANGFSDKDDNLFKLEYADSEEEVFLIEVISFLKIFITDVS